MWNSGFFGCPEVFHHVLGPLVSLGEQDLAWKLRVDHLPQPLQERMRLRKVLADRPLPLDEIGHGITPEPIQTHAQPVADDVQHLFLDSRVVVVEIRLVAEEAMPEVETGFRVIGPVRDFGVDEDDARVRIAGRVIAPDVVITIGRVRILASLLKPGMLVGGVVDDQIGDDLQPALMRRVEQRLEVHDGAVVVMDAHEIGDVVPVVLVRRGIHRQQPDAIHAKLPDVVEFLGHAPEVTDAVIVGIEERLDGRFVEHRVLEPERIATHRASTGAGLSSGPITSSTARIILTNGPDDDEPNETRPGRYHDVVMSLVSQVGIVARHG